MGKPMKESKIASELLQPGLLKELDAVQIKLARTQAKSRRRHKALRSLNRAIQRRTAVELNAASFSPSRPIFRSNTFMSTVMFLLGILVGAVLMWVAVLTQVTQ